MPTVSVIIPAYNADKTILETIKSVQQQTFLDFELIVINDGSTDRTLEFLNSVEDPRLNIFSYSNGGLPVARNRGISHATGEFIAFLDADDLWTPDKLELQLASLQQHPEAGVAYSWTYFMEKQGESLSFNPCDPLPLEGNVYAKLLVRNLLHNGSNPLIRKQAIDSIGEFDSTLKSCEDWDFYLRLAARWPFVLVPKYQIFYRQSSGSMTSKVEIIEQTSFLVLEKAFRAAPPELLYLKNQSWALIFQCGAQRYLKYSTDISGVNKAGQKLLMAIRLQPQILLDRHIQSLIKWFIKKWILIRFPLYN